MNFLEIINKCLLELNYKQVNSYSELVKNDHKRIMTILNIINKEICMCEGWNFLLRKTTLNIPAQTSEIENTVDGRILYLFIDGQKYDFNENVETFVSGCAKEKTYSTLGNNLLFPKFNTDKVANVVYYTKKCVISDDNTEKTDFEAATDKSMIPMPFAQQILVYGTCLRMKANPQYFKFAYWLGMYNEALSNLKSKSSVSVLNAPQINVFRR